MDYISGQMENTHIDIDTHLLLRDKAFREIIRNFLSDRYSKRTENLELKQFDVQVVRLSNFLRDHDIELETTHLFDEWRQQNNCMRPNKIVLRLHEKMRNGEALIHKLISFINSSTLSVEIKDEFRDSYGEDDKAKFSALSERKLCEYEDSLMGLMRKGLLVPSTGNVEERYIEALPLVKKYKTYVVEHGDKIRPIWAAYVYCKGVWHSLSREEQREMLGI